MGSFFERCDVSGLCIEEGTEAYLIPLLPNKGYRGIHRGPEYEYGPAGLPIHGTYADYGMLNATQGTDLTFLREAVHEAPESDHDLIRQLTRHEATVSESSGLYFKSLGHKLHHIKYYPFWVRSDIYQYVSDLNVPLGETLKESGAELSRFCEEALLSLDDDFQRPQQWWAGEKGALRRKALLYLSPSLLLNNSECPDLMSYLFPRGEGTTALSHFALRKTSELILERAFLGEEFDNLLERVADFIVFCKGLEQLGVGWLPKMSWPGPNWLEDGPLAVQEDFHRHVADLFATDRSRERE